LTYNIYSSDLTNRSPCPWALFWTLDNELTNVHYRLNTQTMNMGPDLGSLA